jgi:hypothetical protein
MVVACIALTVALGGTSYAAITLPKNSVGTTQLKKNAVTGPKLKANAVTGPKLKANAVTGPKLSANAVTSPKVANDSLTGQDLNEATLGTVPSATTAGTAAPSGAASGDLTGTYPGPAIAADAVTSAKVVDAAQSTGLRKADIGVISTTVSFDPPSIPAETCSSDSATVTGAATNDLVVAHPVSAIWTNLIYAPWLAQTNLVTLRICNVTAAPIDGPSISFHVLLIR